ncbi:MAG: OB-fold nucleic acid binding domain-containing protein, partial [Candidatus Zixiibacteriota bacterium]
KDSKLMAEQKKAFLEGCDRHNVGKKIAERIFEQIEKFARYGFNRAHSVCYGYVAYQTAYLKAHYPREFFAALMTSEIDSAERIYVLLEECRQLGISVLPPDVNESELGFTVAGDAIRFGLLAVKNVGEGSVQAIVEARHKDGEFTSLGDFARRVNPRALNRRTLESLIHAGATDSLPGARQQKAASVSKMLEFGARAQETSSSRDLFADASGGAERQEPELPVGEEYPTAELLGREKETLGFYISGHPLDSYRTLVGQFRITQIDRLVDAPEDSEVRVVGIFSSVSLKNDKRGKQMAFATLEDFTGATELVCFSDCYEKCRSVISVSRLALVIGRISTREGEAPKILAEELAPLEEIIERFDCQVVIKVAQESADQTLGEALKALEDAEGAEGVAGSEGQKPLLIEYRENGVQALIQSDKYRINPSQEILTKLRTILGDDGFYLKPRRSLSSSAGRRR